MEDERNVVNERGYYMYGPDWYSNMMEVERNVVNERGYYMYGPDWYSNMAVPMNMKLKIFSVYFCEINCNFN